MFLLWRLTFDLRCFASDLWYLPHNFMFTYFNFWSLTSDVRVLTLDFQFSNPNFRLLTSDLWLFKSPTSKTLWRLVRSFFRHTLAQNKFYTRQFSVLGVFFASKGYPFTKHIFNFCFRLLMRDCRLPIFECLFMTSNFWLRRFPSFFRSLRASNLDYWGKSYVSSKNSWNRRREVAKSEVPRGHSKCPILTTLHVTKAKKDN